MCHIECQEEALHHILIGLFGFIFIALADIAACKKIPLVKPLAWVIGIFLLVYAAASIISNADRLQWGVWLAIPGVALLFLSLLGLIYTLFINLPFREVYVEGTSQKLVKTGLYAVVRHPGLYPFFGVMLGLVMVFPSSETIIAAGVWTLADLLLIIFEDKVIFPRIFPGYEIYKEETPMLIPHLDSLKK